MASGVGFLLILIGGFVMAIGYQDVSQHCISGANMSPDIYPGFVGCLNPFYTSQYSDSWSTYLGEFWLGAVFAIIGTIILVGPSFIGFLEGLRGRLPDK